MIKLLNERKYRQVSKMLFYEKKEEIWLSPVTKTPTPTEQSKKQRDNIKTPPKTLITQLLRTDLGRSVGVTAVTQLVWLNHTCKIFMEHFLFVLKGLEYFDFYCKCVNILSTTSNTGFWRERYASSNKDTSSFGDHAPI